MQSADRLDNKGHETTTGTMALETAFVNFLIANAGEIFRLHRPSIIGAMATPTIIPPTIAIADESRGKIKGTVKDHPEALKGPNFTVKTLTAEQIDNQTILDVSRFFRFIFNNAEPWGEYVVCRDCDQKRPDGMKLSARDVWRTGKEYVPTDQMDLFPVIPDCSCCGKKMEIFHDPKTTYESIKKKLTGKGHVSLLTENKTDRLSGFTFGYGATLEEEFKYEWKNKYSYMADQRKEHERDFEIFLRQMRLTFPEAGFTPGTEIFAWNCFATAPWARDAQNDFVKMMHDFFSTLPAEYSSKYMVGQTISGSNAHKIFKAGSKDVEGVLDEKGSIIVVGRVQRAIERFSTLIKLIEK